MADRPNILMVLVDQMQAAVVEEGHPCIMPTVRQLAREGVTLTRHYTPSPHCCPARATLMTGLYPSQHGIWNNVSNDTAHSTQLNAGVRPWSEFLGAGGYALGYSGKWHVEREGGPSDYGWREYSPRKQIGFLGPDVFPQMAASGVPSAKGPREFGHIRRPGWGELVTLGETLEGPDALERAHWYADGVGPGLDAIRELAAEQDAGGAEGAPWCVCISTDMDYGNPIPADIEALYADMDVQLPASYADGMRDKPRIYHRIRRQLYDQLSPDEARAALKHYWCLCTLQDRFMARILETLEATGQADNTMVVFLADHGEYGLAHGLCNMGIPAFNEAYHIPCIVRMPRGMASDAVASTIPAAAAPGTRVDAFSSLTDLGPTFLDLAGALPVDYRFAGRSLLPMLTGEGTPADWPTATCSQTKGNECYYTQRIITTADWKYVCNWFDYDELYDRRNDPHELVNLAYPSDAAFERPSDGGPREADPDFQPWPPLSPELDAVRLDLLRRLWAFAFAQRDLVFNRYAPIAVPPYGPLVGLTPPLEP